MSLHPFMPGILITQQGLMTFPSSSLHLPSNYWEESCFVYKKLHFAKQCSRTELRDLLARLIHGERTERSHVWDREEARWGSCATS
ncbi:hypothetical protein RLOC_00011673 [Lonchura striata]|uniref:Uncharacterized protein n=1 Tax=Lonchura striata TaxID=40157 RepID=A0A218UJF2_9PASE|nr:hypothetical protein RLOC_00011673 [Lonchura striata domestica]